MKEKKPRWYTAVMKDKKERKHLFSACNDSIAEAEWHARHCGHGDGFTLLSIKYVGTEEPANAGAFVPIDPEPGRLGIA
jgi:hypothetical protein